MKELIYEVENADALLALKVLVEDYNESKCIEYVQWTDRPNLITYNDSTDGYMNLVIEKFQQLTANSYISKC